MGCAPSPDMPFMRRCSSDQLVTNLFINQVLLMSRGERRGTVTETSARRVIKLGDHSSRVWEGEVRSRDLRGDGNLGPCLLLDLLQVAALLSNQPAYVVVASDDLQRDFFHPTPTNTRRFGYT